MPATRKPTENPGISSIHRIELSDPVFLPPEIAVQASSAQTSTLRGMQYFAQQDRISGRVARRWSDREQSLCVCKPIASADMITAGLDG